LGPSGSGKSTLVAELHRRGLVDITPSWTTRPPRENEGDATIEHRFVSEREFTDLTDAGTFLETVRLFDLPYRYGLPAVAEPDAGKVATIMVRSPLMPLLDRHFPDRVIYQVEDQFDRVQARVTQRFGVHDELGSRLEGYEAERLAGREVADRIFVNDGTIDDLVATVVDALGDDFPGLRRDDW
jgi:guanylate kinase